jgi:hypothetical protein
MASGESWSDYVQGWAQEERVHRAETVVRLLDERFRRNHFAKGPYFFPDLAETTAADELAAIQAGLIQATRVDYVGQR